MINDLITGHLERGIEVSRAEKRKMPRPGYGLPGEEGQKEGKGSFRAEGERARIA